MKFRQRNLKHRRLLTQYTQETVSLRSNTGGGHKREPRDFLIHSFPRGKGSHLWRSPCLVLPPTNTVIFAPVISKAQAILSGFSLCLILVNQALGYWFSTNLSACCHVLRHDSCEPKPLDWKPPVNSVFCKSPWPWCLSTVIEK